MWSVKSWERDRFNLKPKFKDDGMVCSFLLVGIRVHFGKRIYELEKDKYGKWEEAYSTSIPLHKMILLRNRDTGEYKCLIDIKPVYETYRKTYREADEKKIDLLIRDLQDAIDRQKRRTEEYDFQWEGKPYEEVKEEAEEYIGYFSTLIDVLKDLKKQLSAEKKYRSLFAGMYEALYSFDKEKMHEITCEFYKFFSEHPDYLRRFFEKYYDRTEHVLKRMKYRMDSGFPRIEYVDSMSFRTVYDQEDVFFKNDVLHPTKYEKLEVIAERTMLIPYNEKLYHMLTIEFRLDIDHKMTIRGIRAIINPVVYKMYQRFQRKPKIYKNTFHVVGEIAKLCKEFIEKYGDI